MITDLILAAMGGIGRLLIALFPSFDPPVFLGQISSGIGWLAGITEGLGVWFPFNHLGVALTVVALALVAAVVIKLVRIVASFFTAGGGSAA